jgi:hypothetical protein
VRFAGQREERPERRGTERGDEERGARGHHRGGERHVHEEQGRERVRRTTGGREDDRDDGHVDQGTRRRRARPEREALAGAPREREVRQDERADGGHRDAPGDAEPERPRADRERGREDGAQAPAEPRRPVEQRPGIDRRHHARLVRRARAGGNAAA